jgi:hypothetical protein
MTVSITVCRNFLTFRQNGILMNVNRFVGFEVLSATVMNRQITMQSLLWFCLLINREDRGDISFRNTPECRCVLAVYQVREGGRWDFTSFKRQMCVFTLVLHLCHRSSVTKPESSNFKPALSVLVCCPAS